MRSDDFNQLTFLSKDVNVIEKIISDKNITENQLVSKLALSNIAIETSAEIQKMSKSISSFDNEQFVLISDQEDIAKVKAITNFTSNITLVSKTKLPTGGVSLVVRYVWDWAYTPVNTLTDMVSLVWSDSFDSDGKDVVFQYSQDGYLRITNPDGSFSYVYSDTASNVMIHKTGDSAYVDSTPSIGFQQRYDIKRVFYKEGKTYQVSKHSGYFQVKLYRNYLPANDDGAISLTGNYFHQTIKPDTTLTLTQDSATLSAAAKIRFDKTNDCARMITYR